MSRGRKAKPTNQKEKRSKKIAIQWIKPTSTEGKSVGAILGKLRAKDHKDLEGAVIGMAWHKGWASNLDGELRITALKKLSPLDKQMHGFDFVLVINKPVWENMEEHSKKAAIDFALCAIRPDMDRDESQKVDEAGNKVWRTRKADIVEFSDNIKRYGFWREGLAPKIHDLRKKIEPLFVESDEHKTAIKKMDSKSEADEDSSDRMVASG